MSRVNRNLCPHCSKDIRLHVYDPEEYQRRKAGAVLKALVSRRAKNLPTRKIEALLPKMYELRDKGLSLSKISKELGIAESTVYLNLKKKDSAKYGNTSL